MNVSSASGVKRVLVISHDLSFRVFLVSVQLENWLQPVTADVEGRDDGYYRGVQLDPTSGPPIEIYEQCQELPQRYAYMTSCGLNVNVLG